MRYFFTFLLLSLLIPASTLAISGACSNHGGVNCSVGSSVNGHAICNDGWESATNFYQTDECSCVPPIRPQYFDSSQCAAIGQQQVNNGMERYSPSLARGDVASCETSVSNYQSELSNYNSCLAQMTQPLFINYPTANQVPTQIVCPQNQVLNMTSNQCQCASGYARDILNVSTTLCILSTEVDQECQKKLLATNAYFNTVKNQCELPISQSIPVTLNSLSTSTFQSPIVSIPVSTSSSLHFVTSKVKINIRSLPSTKGKVLSVTSVGIKYQEIREQSGWVEIQFGKKQGWVLKSLVNVL